MQRFVPRALFLKMAAPFDIHSVLLGRNGYGRNGYWPKWFWAENVQMTSDAFIFNYAPVLARVLTQNGRLKNKDAIFVCLNFYATVRCKKALSQRQLQGMPRSAARCFFETYRCVGKHSKTFRSAPLMQRTQVGLCIGKTDNNFREKGFNFCPATLVTARKGLRIVKTDSLI